MKRLLKQKSGENFAAKFFACQPKAIAFFNTRPVEVIGRRIAGMLDRNGLSGRANA